MILLWRAGGGGDLIFRTYHWTCFCIFYLKYKQGTHNALPPIYNQLRKIIHIHAQTDAITSYTGVNWRQGKGQAYFWKLMIFTFINLLHITKCMLFEIYIFTWKGDLGEGKEGRKKRGRRVKERGGRERHTDRRRERESSTCWVASQIITMAAIAGPDRSQESTFPSRSAMQVAGAEALEPLPLLS